MSVPRLTVLAALTCCPLAATAPLRAVETAGGFTTTLPADTQAAAGLTILSVAERAALDRLVAQEVASAREQNITEFSGTFTARLAEEDRKAAGLDRLDPAQLAKLNELVATAIAARPKPKERPRIKDSEVFAAARQPEIHGSVTLAYGWGGGRSFMGESLQLDYYDPDHHFGLSVGLNNSTGPGFYNNGYPGYYGYGPRYYDAAPFSYDASYRDDPRDDFIRGDGQSFSRGGGWGGYRRH